MARTEDEDQTKEERAAACECGLTEAQRKLVDEVFDKQRFRVGPFEACHLAVAAALKAQK